MASGPVVIALPDDPARARAVLDRGRRLAWRLGVAWVALRIGGRAAALEVVSAAAALGGRVICENAPDTAATLVEIASREHALILVIGRSRRSRIMRRLRRGTTERILGASRQFAVVVAGEGAAR